MMQKRAPGFGWGVLDTWDVPAKHVWYCEKEPGLVRRKDRDIAQAALFTESEALDEERHIKSLYSRLVPPDKMRRLIQEQIRQTEARLGNLTALLRRLDEVTP